MNERPISREDCMWAMCCHLAAFFGYLVPILGNIIGPMAIWLAKRDQSAYIDTQGKEALNFQITMSIAFIISAILMIVVIGVFLMPLVALLNVILIIAAAISTYKGQPFRYPFCLRFIR